MKKELFKWFSISIFIILIVSLSHMSISVNEATQAVIWTDKQDYSPNGIVTIFGKGFLANADITVTIERPDGTIDTVYALTDDFGSFTCTYRLDGITGTYTVIVTDGTNTAMTTFTDKVVSINITVNPTSVTTGSTTEFTVTISVPSGTGYHTVGSITISMGTVSGANWGTPGAVSISGFPGASNWVVYNTGTGLLQIRCNPAASDENMLQPGETMTVTFTVTAPSATGTSTWTVTAYNTKEFTGSSDTKTQSVTVTTPPPSATMYVSYSIVGDGLGYSAPMFNYVDPNGQSKTYTLTTTSTKIDVQPSSSWSVTPNPLTGSSVSERWYSIDTLSGTAGGSGSSETRVFTFYHQYYLTVNNGGHGTASGEGWYDSGTSASFSISPTTVSGGSGIQYVFTGWVGSGTGSYTGTDSSYSVTMDNPITETAQWKTQYYLTVLSAYDTPGGEEWYDSGTTAYATLVDGVVSGGPGIRYVFTDWSGDASGTGLTSDGILMNAPKTATANWETQYLLTIKTNGLPSSHPTKVYLGGSEVGTASDTSPYTQWFDENDPTGTIGINGIISGATNTQYVFTKWDEDSSTNNPRASVNMDAPKTFTTNYKTQYQLTVHTSGLGTHITNVYNGTTVLGTATDATPYTNWFDKDNFIQLDIDSPITDGSTRFVFTQWSDDATGTVRPTSMTMNTPKDITANYKTQYYLTLATNPLGVTTPTGAGWYDEGDYAPISTDQYVDIISGSSRYRFNGWTTGDMSEIADPTLTSTTVLMDKAKTVTANYVVQYYLTNNLIIGSLNSITPSPTFDSWYDTGTNVDIILNYVWDVVASQSRSNLISYATDEISTTVPRSGTGTFNLPTITMNTYHIVSDASVTQYYLTNNLIIGSVNSITPSQTLDSWYDSGSSVTIVLNYVWDVVAFQSRNNLLSYAIDGVSTDVPRADSGTFTVPTITMSTYHFVADASVTQYYLTVSSDYDTPTPTSDWFDAGTEITASVTSPADESDGTRYRCTGWTGTGSVPVSGTTTSVIFTINAPSSITWNWIAQYYLTMSTNYGTVSPGNGWYDAGSVVSISATAPSTVDGERYVWLGWTGTGTISYTGMDNPATDSVTMNSPVTETASWRHEYRLTMATNMGTTSPSVGAHWIEADTSLDIQAFAPDLVYSADNEQYVWLGWAGSGLGSYTNGDNPASITMNGPITETATWRHEFRLTVATNFGTASPSVGDHWYEAGSGVSIQAFAPALVYPADQEQYVWNGWTGTGTISYSGMDNTPSVTMNGPITETASWTHQYRLTMATNFGSTSPSAGDHWYEAGTPVSIEAFAPSVISGERYVWNGWTGTGDGSYTDTNNPSSVTMNGPISETASWTHQYLLTINTNGLPSPYSTKVYLDSSEVGTAYDGSPFTKWFDENDPTGTIGVDGTIGLPYEYVFTKWDEDSSTDNPRASVSTSGPKTFTADYGLPPEEVVTVTASPSGAIGGSFKVTYTKLGILHSNELHTTPWYEGVDPATTVTVSEPQDIIYDSLPGIRYKFDHYNPLTGSIIMNDESTITLVYKTQYYLTVVSAHGTTGGEGWYDEGDPAYATVTPLIVPGPTGVRYVFTHWSSDATGTTSPSDPITMDGPKTATANWKTQYYLTVNNGGHGTATGEGWYDASLSASFSISPTTVSGGAGTRYMFTGWVGSYTGSDTSHSVTMNNPITETAQWRTQYYLTVTSAYDTPSGAGWYNSGTTAYATLANGIVSGGTGTRYVFTGWGGGASGTGLTSNPITMNGPKTATANWKTQYYLVVYSFYDFSTGQGWYDSGSTASSSVTSPFSGGAGIHYVATGFVGTGSAPSSGSGTSVSFTINSPSSITWNWKTQYYLTLATHPSGVNSPSGEGWYDAGTYASISTEEYVNNPGSSRYRFNGWTGEIAETSSTSTTVLMNEAKTVTANYVTQYKVTFYQSGVDQDFLGTVAIIAGNNYGQSALSNGVELWIDGSSSVSFTYYTPLTVSSEKSYVLVSVDQSSPLTVTASTTVTATYEAIVHIDPTVILTLNSQSGVAGSTLNYTLSITNNDDPSFGPSEFFLTYSVPSGWTASLSNTSVIIAPGSTDSSITLSVTSSGLTSIGNYNISVIVSNTGATSCQGVGSAIYSVVSAVPTVEPAAMAAALFASTTLGISEAVGKGLLSKLEADFEVEKEVDIKRRIRRRREMIFLTAAILIVGSALFYGHIETIHETSSHVEWGEIIQEMGLLLVQTMILASIVLVISYVARLIFARHLGAKVEYRLWIFGVISLFITTLLFKAPFGAPGKVNVTKDTPHDVRGKLSLLVILVVIATSGILYILLVLGYPTEIGVYYGLTLAACSSIPVKPLAGHEIYHYNKILSIVLVIVCYTLFFLFVF